MYKSLRMMIPGSLLSVRQLLSATTIHRWNKEQCASTIFLFFDYWIISNCFQCLFRCKRCKIKCEFIKMDQLRCNLVFVVKSRQENWIDLVKKFAWLQRTSTNSECVSEQQISKWNFTWKHFCDQWLSLCVHKCVNRHV